MKNKKSRQTKLIELVNNGYLQEDDILFLRRTKEIARIHGNNLKYSDNQIYSMSDLAKKLLHLSYSPQGPAYWFTKEGKSIKDLWKEYLTKNPEPKRKKKLKQKTLFSSGTHEKKTTELLFIELFGTSHKVKYWSDILKIVVDVISYKNSDFDKRILNSEKLKNKFSTTEEEARINATGYSTQPHRIANSRLWIKLHSDTKTKIEIIKNLFDEFNYDPKELLVIEKVLWEKIT